MRLNLLTGSTATFDLAKVGAADNDWVSAVRAVRNDGLLVLVQAGEAPAVTGSVGSTAAGAVTVRTDRAVVWRIGAGQCDEFRARVSALVGSVDEYPRRSAT